MDTTIEIVLNSMNNMHENITSFVCSSYKFYIQENNKKFESSLLNNNYDNFFMKDIMYNKILYCERGSVYDINTHYNYNALFGNNILLYAKISNLVYEYICNNPQDWNDEVFDLFNPEHILIFYCYIYVVYNKSKILQYILTSLYLDF
jgi:hypothetical protein